MPKLWSETIADHRREVRDAILEMDCGHEHEHPGAGGRMTYRSRLCR